MTESEWTQVRTYLEHSGLSAEEVMKACAEHHKVKQIEPTSDPMHAAQMSLPGVEHFNGA